MPRKGSEPSVPGFERHNTVRDFDIAATGIGEEKKPLPHLTYVFTSFLE